ncbi:nuclear transport factor 2 family protein [Piscinibacter sp. HJYY11]|uniref:nuclear transport factor 2 family protein n=1 Tax=Piscinibacter sp. HJYY11 TaxID=2801333 RepID=UPI00191D6C0C|nr:nuclear transport factor 2 family protein [Piscinibacter sp. HJYY11]MBL0727288.1 nuclear transport factor 2 family protein [Piscinibacter sp. HJYY11]
MSPVRRLLLAAAGEPIVAALGAAFTPAAASAAPSTVDALVRNAEQGHQALMQGDIERYQSFLQLSDDFTLMAPFGGPPTRSGHYTPEQWAAIGRFFRHGRDSTLELIRAYEADGLVVLVATEHSHVAVGAVPAQPWSLRVTLVFREDGGQWRLVHRHADPLVGAISVEKAGELARAGGRP